MLQQIIHFTRKETRLKRATTVATRIVVLATGTQVVADEGRASGSRMPSAYFGDTVLPRWSTRCWAR